MKADEIEIVDNENLTEEELEAMSTNELLEYAGQALSCFVDERWQGITGKAWQLMVLEEIKKREGNGL